MHSVMWVSTTRMRGVSRLSLRTSSMSALGSAEAGPAGQATSVGGREYGRLVAARLQDHGCAGRHVRQPGRLGHFLGVVERGDEAETGAAASRSAGVGYG